MFLSFLFLLTNIAISDEIIVKESWEVRPNIYICTDSSKITKSQVKESIDFWVSEYDIDFSYKSLSYLDDCSDKFYENIYITGDWQITGTRLANTTLGTFVYESNPKVHYIDFAIVNIPNSYKDNKILLLHEIGHAIGLKHSDNYIMKQYHDF